MKNVFQLWVKKKKKKEISVRVERIPMEKKI